MPEIFVDLTAGVLQVTFDANFILSLIGLMGAFALAVWGIMKFMINRYDSMINAVHERIEKVRIEYARKEDIDKELERIYQSITDSRNQVTTQIQSVNARLDSIMNALHVRRID